MKLSKWYNVIFRCPKCGVESDYGLQIGDGPHKGSGWNPAYWCEKCNSAAQVRDSWFFGAVYGPLMALCAAMAFDALPRDLGAAFWARILFAGLCCAIVGWPLSRYLSRHIVSWESREPQHSCDSGEHH